jgi:acylphosphatase
MRMQVGKCYRLKRNGVETKFRVVRNLNNKEIYVKLCGTDEEQELFTQTLAGDIGENFEIIEIDCLLCDGKPSL